jgi:hypothetical protein
LSISSNLACGTMTLSTSCLYKNAKWEISDGPTNTFHTVGDNSSRISLTERDISAAGLNAYGNIYVRVSDSDLAGRTSELTSFKLSAPPPVVSLVSTTDVVCNGEANGTVTLKIAKTTTPVNRFLISIINQKDPTLNDQVANVSPDTIVIPGLRAGVWSFKVSNSDNTTLYGACFTEITPVFINEQPPLSIELHTTDYNGYPIKCSGDANGEIIAEGKDGNRGYKDFLWSTGSTVDQVSGLVAGVYSVSLKDAKDCTASASITLTQPPPLQLTLQPSDYNGYPVSCWNKSDGHVNAVATGGVGGYSYHWTNGQTSPVATSLRTQNYGITLTDSNGCPISSNLTLTAPPPIDFVIDETTSLLCPGDQTAILAAKSVTHTIGTFSYGWSSGENVSSISNKGAGSYSLTISDEQNCSTTKSKTIANPPAYSVSLQSAVDYHGSFIKCHGDSNGELVAHVLDSNGKPTTAQNYLWAHDGTEVADGPSLSSLDNLSRGQYKVTITYDNQCKTDASYFLTDPDPITVNVIPTTNYNGQAISCNNAFDANLKASATGGTGAYNYQWASGETAVLLTGKGAGDYTVTVTDVNLCTGTGALTVLNPNPIVASVVSVSDFSGYGVSCQGLHDGTITAKGSGGTGIYSYTWSNGENTPVITHLPAALYTLSISDNNGCHSALQQAITEPTALTVSVANKQDVLCFGGNSGAIELIPSGGVGNYSFSKDNGTLWQPSSTFSTLPYGAYTLMARDGNQCSATTSTSLTQPSQINISFTDISPAFCNNPAGTARAVVSGGVGGYTYAWQDSQSTPLGTNEILSNVKGGIYTVVVHDTHACERSNHVPITSTDGAKSNYVSTAARCFDSSDGHADITITQGDGPFAIHWPDGQTTLQNLQLKRGAYDVLITDVHQCTVVQTVSITSPDALALNVITSEVPTCHGVCDGKLSLQATGGVGAYAYHWNEGSLSTQTQLCASVYPITINDGNGCVLIQDVELQEPEPVSIRMTKEILPTCRDGCDGRLEITAAGGNGDYSYAWFEGGNTALSKALCPGEHKVTVTDKKGCTSEEILTLNNTPAVPLDLGGNVTLCVGQSYTLRAGSGWSGITWGSNVGFTSTDENVTIKDPGKYWLQVTSAKGCIGQDTFLLATSYDLLQASFLIPHEAEAGDTVVMIDISWPLPEKVEWAFPSEMKQISNTGDVLQGQFYNKGTYTVSLTAHLGECIDQLSKTITILDMEEDAAGGRLGHEEFLKEFTLYPNPNQGSFEVGVELQEESAIAMGVWNSPMGILIEQVQRKGDKIYRVYFDLKPLPAGTYVLRLDHAKGQAYRRFVVH